MILTFDQFPSIQTPHAFPSFRWCHSRPNPSIQYDPRGAVTFITPYHLLLRNQHPVSFEISLIARFTPETILLSKLRKHEPSMLLDMFHLHKRAAKKTLPSLHDIGLMDASPRDFLTSIRCTKLPPILWRVQHVDSQASFNDTCDLVAKLHGQLPHSLYELRAALSRHLKWGYSRADSYFISTFEEYRDALEWARERKKRCDDDGVKVAIYRIRTSQLGEQALVFRVDRMMRRLGMDLGADGVGREGEYVILNRVSARAMSLCKDNVDLSLPSHTLKLDTFTRPGARATPFDRCMKRRSYVYNAARLSSTDALFASYMARVEVEQQRMSLASFESLDDSQDERYAAGGEREEYDRVDSLVSIIESDRKLERLKWKPLPMRPKSKLLQAVEKDLGVDVTVGEG
ncbi:hypothetical protein CLAFUW4_06311 [Fulvia fulva]|uniref:DUF7587 domain-containing protein n=1 Tax=Passalora fulva TaxID=5499 RepID=A0A9Q8LH75_PASFU|nr:uncharacterized protein CLAFUR5_06455 [Fulvia fulva]KAK4624287.1 hypothetical protein CLAFUR4_06314 [Fulvia fulva]KAK4625068.1 hypothetical protein CLAFUR0_06318 [Fulvia fulva]UJO17366.1 hypothetical protein CLAFUR5_06455 [Fulvia fulva]WPV14666.1 hypothetical protein CLAFUW4_06311 [Fulvia fulva]WPV30099.1 hypothetical protein CLAFUW7_06309 [Fulvia fulva]